MCVCVCEWVWERERDASLYRRVLVLLHTTYVTIHVHTNFCGFLWSKRKKTAFLVSGYALLFSCHSFPDDVPSIQHEILEKTFVFFSALTTHSQTSSILSIFGRFSLHTFKNRPCTCHGFFYYTLNISQSMCILIFLAVCEAKIGFFSKKSQFLAFLIFKPHFWNVKWPP